MTFWNRVYCLLGLWTYILLIPDSCSCILQVRYSRHYRHKIPTLSKTNYYMYEPEPVMLFTSDQIS